MKYFLDTEFEEDGETIMPISLGLISENWDRLYIEFDFDEERARKNGFVRENVLPNLEGHPRVSKREAAARIKTFLGLPKRPAQSQSPIEIWAYFAATDWVLFYQLWGGLLDLPKGIPHHCMDLQQWWVQLVCPKDVKPPKPTDAHNALADATWNAVFHNKLDSYDDEEI